MTSQQIAAIRAQNAELYAAIARRDPTVTYERGEFDIDGHPVIRTYRASNPYQCIACRDAA